MGLRTIWHVCSAIYMAFERTITVALGGCYRFVELTAFCISGCLLPSRDVTFCVRSDSSDSYIHKRKQSKARAGGYVATDMSRGHRGRWRCFQHLTFRLR